MLRIGGYQGISGIDYPGRICAVVFTQGCNMDPPCPYCHNPTLIPESGGEMEIPEGEVLYRLEHRRNVIQCLSVTGGEPTMQGDALIAFLRRVRSLGYQVKLDTNGTNRDVLRRILELDLVHYVALDLKGGPEAYPADGMLASVYGCLDDLREFQVPCEARTTCDGRVVEDGVILDMALEVGKRRIRWFLQDARPPGKPFPDMSLLLELAKQRTALVWRR